MFFAFVFFFQAEDGIRDVAVTGVQTCALPISAFRRLVELRARQARPAGTNRLPARAGDPPGRSAARGAPAAGARDDNGEHSPGCAAARAHPPRRAEISARSRDCRRAGIMPEGHAAFAGRRIWYRDSGGNGVPVVFLHAGTGSSLTWELQVPAFTAVGYRVIAYDRLGHGRSMLEPGAQPGTAADDLEGLARHLQLDRFHLVGTAAGGIVALDYALSFARRLRSLVVANSIGG